MERRIDPDLLLDYVELQIFPTDNRFLAGRSTYDQSESLSFIVSATEKVFVPGAKSVGSSSTEQLEALDADTEILQNDASLDEEQLYDMTEKEYVTSSILVEDIAVTEEEPIVYSPDISKENEVIRQLSIPSPGAGKRIYEIDPLLGNHRQHLEYRETGITYREWAPGAKNEFGVWEIFLPDDSPPIPHGSRVKKDGTHKRVNV